jgi:hypothetical protein
MATSNIPLGRRPLPTLAALKSPQARHEQERPAQRFIVAALAHREASMATGAISKPPSHYAVAGLATKADLAGVAKNVRSRRWSTTAQCDNAGISAMVRLVTCGPTDRTAAGVVQQLGIIDRLRASKSRRHD